LAALALRVAVQTRIKVGLGYHHDHPSLIVRTTIRASARGKD
jgi:hypothetical protein